MHMKINEDGQEKRGMVDWLAVSNSERCWQMVTEALNSAGWQAFAMGFLPDSLIAEADDTFKANWKCTLSLALYIQLSISSLTLSFFLWLLFSFPLPLALSNLSVLFYLPEGEWFWITGLINKVNTDRQPLTQRCADRAEKQRGTECVWG